MRIKTNYRVLICILEANVMSEAVGAAVEMRQEFRR